MSHARGAGRAALLVVFALPGATAVTAGDARSGLDRLPRERVVLETRAHGSHDYRAWRADTPETRAHGLMYVATLADDEAMIFVYDQPQVVKMWMKNTYVPLDMLFVDARGCIVSIVERAKPLSLASIESGAPVVLVVEIRGGAVAARSVQPGDRVLRPDAAWPAAARGAC